jgi:predicted O-methyltransferase YrrM
MNQVLESIVKTGRTVLPTGDDVEATSYIDEYCGSLLQNIITTTRPEVGVEVGLAFGISALYILDAFQEIGGQKLIGIDPAQHDQYWRGGGLYNIRRAGYESLYEFYESTSQQILPALVGKGQRIQFAFIDGWHTFDHTLVDFFYIDQMLDVGSVVVFDDVAYPSIRRVCDFVLTNRDYEINDCVRLQQNGSFRQDIKHRLKNLLNPFVRTDKTPALDAQDKEHKIKDVYFLALKKRSEDARKWDHFVQF